MHVRGRKPPSVAGFTVLTVGEAKGTAKLQKEHGRVIVRTMAMLGICKTNNRDPSARMTSACPVPDWVNMNSR